MAAVPRTGLRERGRSRPWYRRLTALKTIKIRPVRPLMTNCKTTVRADCSFFVELPPSASEISSSLRWLCVGSLPWTGVQSLSPPPWLCMLSVQAQSFRLCATHGLALQAPLSMGFFRQEYWSGLPCPPPGDPPDPEIEPESPVSPVLAGRFFTPEPPGKPPVANI